MHTHTHWNCHHFNFCQTIKKWLECEYGSTEHLPSLCNPGVPCPAMQKGNYLHITSMRVTRPSASEVTGARYVLVPPTNFFKPVFLKGGHLASYPPPSGLRPLPGSWLLTGPCLDYLPTRLQVLDGTLWLFCPLRETRIPQRIRQGPYHWAKSTVSQFTK